MSQLLTHPTTFHIPDSELVWEMLVAGIRPERTKGAGATSMFGFSGSQPLVERSASLAIDHLPSLLHMPEILTTLIGLRLIPAGARVNIFIYNIEAAHALKSNDLPVDLSGIWARLISERKVHIELVNERTPNLIKLTEAARASLLHTTSYATILGRLKL